MDIPSIPDYNSVRFSGCSHKFANFYGKDRLYAHGLEYGITVFPIIALFDFIWQYKKDNTHKAVILRNMSFNGPLQLLTIDGEVDYESFHSLN